MFGFVCGGWCCCYALDLRYWCWWVLILLDGLLWVALLDVVLLE